MKDFILDSYHGIMDHKRNPLRHINDFNTRHMVTQILAWMWCIVFSLLVGSWTVFGFTVVAHFVFLIAIFITVATFETAKRNPGAFKFIKGYHSYGRTRDYVMYRDKYGMPYKVKLDPRDPGGEHE
mgnify:FL=1|tara:strand:+ start:544 stop:921 length:378 start_codon:yes stop_codon:yes gene_type:complete